MATQRLHGTYIRQGLRTGQLLLREQWQTREPQRAVGQDREGRKALDTAC